MVRQLALTEFYKAHSDILANMLLRRIKHSINNNVYPDSLYEANICQLLEKAEMKQTLQDAGPQFA